jgi:hypothetical protein
MARFASLHGYFEFQRNVRRESRFIHNEQTKEFLKTVLETSTPRLKRLRRDSILYRAQRGFSWKTERAGEYDEFDVETAFGPERMVPKAEFVGDGR